MYHGYNHKKTRNGEAPQKDDLVIGDTAGGTVGQLVTYIIW